MADERSTRAADTAHAQADEVRAPTCTATVSSLKSEDSTERLIASVPQKLKHIKSVEHSVTSKSVDAGSESPARRRLLVVLGLAQVVLGALLVCAGAAGVARGAALARTGAGLWAGAVAVAAGVVGVLAGINDCHGLSAAQGGGNGGGLATAFLALSLLCVASGNGAAVLAATGLQRDLQRARSPPALPSFQDEMEAWTPVLVNIGMLLAACAHCLVAVVSVCQLARRVCACLRPRTPFDLNTFAPHDADADKSVDVVDGLHAAELCKDLEGKLQGVKKLSKQEECCEFGSANSKEKLVSRWLGSAPPSGPLSGPPSARPMPVAHPPRARRPPPAPAPRTRPPVMLLPAHPASTLGRGPPACVMVPRYATLPLPPAPFPHPAHPPHGHHPMPPPLYYHMPDGRLRRRRSPRELRARRRRELHAGNGHGNGQSHAHARRDQQLTRSLERIHRKRRADRERPSDADLKRTYTGLDRAYAEQFIAVCDESRTAHDSLHSTSTASHSHSHDDTSHTSS